MNETLKLIQQAIDSMKDAPRGSLDPEWKNRTLSNLKNAFATASLMTRPDHPANQPLPDAPPPGTCTCLPGAVDSLCPVHGHKNPF